MSSTDLQPPAVRRNLRLILIDSIVFSLMVGLVESYFPAFVLALGYGEALAGLTPTLPMLLGSLGQLIAPAGVMAVGSHRRWVVCSVSIQALSFVPLIAIALLAEAPTWAVFLFLSGYWCGGLGSAGAWSTWVGRLIPPEVRARYMAFRTRFLQAGTLVGLLAAGILLQYVTESKHKLLAFAGIFALAGACRASSAVCLWMHGEAPIELHRQRVVSPMELLRRFRHGGNGRLLGFMLIMQVASQIGTPFFAPYLLRELEASYGAFMILTSAAFVGRFAALPLLGRIAQHRGAMHLLWIGAIGITPAAALWTASSSLVWLLVAQVLSGFVWAAYELATILLYFEAIDEAERTSVVTTFNVANAAAMTAGSLLGAGCLHWLGEDATAYLAIFWISTAARLATLLLLARIGGSKPVAGQA